MNFKSKQDDKVYLKDVEYGELFRFVNRDLYTSYEVCMRVYNSEGGNDGVICAINGELVPPRRYNCLCVVERIKGEFVEF